MKHFTLSRDIFYIHYSFSAAQVLNCVCLDVARFLCYKNILLDLVNSWWVRVPIDI